MAANHLYAGIAANIDVKTVGDAEVTNYEQAAAFLGDAREKQLASNVTVVRVDATTIGLKLYHTIIVAYYANGQFSVDNGGFNTPTTSRRINQFTPAGWHFHHHQKKLAVWNSVTFQSFTGLNHWTHLGQPGSGA